MRRRASFEMMKKKKKHRYLLVPPHLSSPFLLPLCLLLFWLSWLFWSWPSFSGLLLPRPQSRRTLPRMLSSCRERGLKVSRWFKCNSWMRRLQTRKTGRYLLEMRLLGSSSSSSPLSSCTASSGMACIWTPGAWGSMRRFSNRRCLEEKNGKTYVELYQQMEDSTDAVVRLSDDVINHTKEVKCSQKVPERTWFSPGSRWCSGWSC